MSTLKNLITWELSMSVPSTPVIVDLFVTSQPKYVKRAKATAIPVVFFGNVHDNTNVRCGGWRGFCCGSGDKKAKLCEHVAKFSHGYQRENCNGILFKTVELATNQKFFIR